VSGGIAPRILNRYQMEVSGQINATAALPLVPIGGCVVHRADLDAVAKRKSPFIILAESRFPVVEPVA